MKKTQKKEPMINIGYYAVAFIDLLGQQERLRDLNSLPNRENPAEMDAFTESLKQTYGVVTGMRDNFSHFFNGYSKYKSDLSQLTKEQRSKYYELTSNPIEFQRFSDSLIVYLSLSTQKYKVAAAGIFGMLAAAATSFLCGLAAGHPIRGGIDLGIGMEITKGEIYGSALAKAYSLESNIANYPRIVIGEELTKYLKMTAEQVPTDINSSVGKEMAKCCLEMMAIDDDGYAIIDYMGEGFKNHIAIEFDTDIIKRAHKYVITSSEQYRRDRNGKLAFRYTLLRSYIEDHLHIWFI